MPENTKNSQGPQNVDGFTDTQADANDPKTPDNPDYGTHNRAKPLSEKERMKAEKEINEQGDHNRVRDRKQK